MTRAECDQQIAVLEGLRRDARFLAERYRLPLLSVEAESLRVKRRYGICYEDGSIRIRLRNLKTGELLKYSAMIDTLCHELAHLKHFNHGRQFQDLYRRILGYARRSGIYRPAPRPSGRVWRAPPPLIPARPASGRAAPARPIQLELFSGDGD